MNLMFQQTQEQRNQTFDNQTPQYRPRSKQKDQGMQRLPRINPATVTADGPQQPQPDNGSTHGVSGAVAQECNLPHLKVGDASAQAKQGRNQPQKYFDPPEGHSISQTTLLQSTVSQQMLTNYYNQEISILNNKVDFLQQKLNKANALAAEQQAKFEKQLDQWNAFYQNKQDQLQQQIGELDAQLKLVQEEKQALQKTREQESLEYKDCQTKMEQFRQTHSNYDESIKQQQGTIQQLHEQNKMMTTQLKIQNDQITQLQQEKEGLLNKIAQFQSIENSLNEKISKWTQTVITGYDNKEVVTDAQTVQYQMTQTEDNILFENSLSEDAEVNKIIEKMQLQGAMTEQMIQAELDKHSKEIDNRMLEQMDTERQLHEQQQRELEQRELALQQLQLQNQQADLLRQLQEKQQVLTDQIQQLSQQQFAGEEECAEPEGGARAPARDGPAADVISTSSAKDINGILAKMTEIKELLKDTPSMPTDPTAGAPQLAPSPGSKPEDGQETKVEDAQYSGKNPATRAPENAVDAGMLELYAQAAQTAIPAQNEPVQEQQPCAVQLPPVVDNSPRGSPKSQLSVGSKNKSEAQKNSKEQSQDGAILREEELIVRASADDKRGGTVENVDNLQGGPAEGKATSEEEYSPEFKKRMEQIITQLLETGEIEGDFSEKQLRYIREQGYELDGSDYIEEKKKSPTKDAEKQPYTQEFRAQMEGIIAKLLESGEVDESLTEQQVQYIREQGYEIDV